MSMIGHAVEKGQGRQAEWLQSSIGISIVVLVSVFLNVRIGTNTDVSWIITIVERLTAGDRLYADILETNPPFSIWLYYPAVQAAIFLGVSPEISVWVFTYLAGFLSIGLSWFIARSGGLVSNQTQQWFWLSVACVYFILPGNVFAQREHIGFIMLVPLLVLQAWRLVEHTERPIPLALAMLAGLSGSVMVLVKPHWSLAILLPAMLIAYRRRSFTSVFRIEYWTVGVVSTSYLLSVFIVHPEFFETVLPIVRQVYIPITQTLSLSPFDTEIHFFIFLVCCVYLRSLAKDAAIADIFICGSIGLFLGAYAMGKWWDYHLYPSVAALTIATFASIEALTKSGMFRGKLRILTVAWCSLVFLAFAYPNHMNVKRLAVGMVSEVSSKYDQPKIAIISHDIALGFPFTRKVNGTWQSAFCSDWAGAYALFRLNHSNEALSDADRAWLQDYVEGFTEQKLSEFQSQRPDVILEIYGDFWSDWIHGNSGFKNFMADYEVSESKDRNRGRLRMWTRIDQTDLAEDAGYSTTDSN